jgi:hypothetical protein
VPGCEIYSIRPLTKFELSLGRLVKSHYKKNKRARDSFEVLINGYIDTLSKDPLFDDSDSENFPKGAYKPDFEFRKIRFFMPELQGASRRGRFMYVVHQASCSVYPIWVYTHEEYSKRPSDQELKEQFAIIEEINIVDVDSPPS